jgi:Kdo2-lipid IVA lauroyltransferase/acyltransferase
MRVYLIKAMLSAFALLPLPVTHMIGVIVGWWLSIIPSELKRVSIVNLKLCLPALDASSRRRLLRDSLIETAKTAAELGPLWYWREERLKLLVKKVSGEEAVQRAREFGHGVIIAAPHLGAWEMVGLYCAARYPMTSLYRPPRISELDSLIHKARSRFGAHMVPTDMSGIRALYNALARGEFVGILPDQEPGTGSGQFAPFYGIPAYTMTLMYRLSCRTRAAIFFTYAERLPKGRGYHLHFVPATQDISEYDQPTALELMNKNIAYCVDSNPAQYQWSYKRFRTRPPGEPNFY